MKTKAYHYTEAVRDIERTKTITREQAIAFIIDTRNKEPEGTIAYNDGERAIEVKHFGGDDRIQHIYLKEADEAKQEVKATGKYPYLETVARTLLVNLGLIADSQRLSRASHICYYTGKYTEARNTIKDYDNMFAQGYIHINDITPDMDGKTALLKGTKDIDMFTVSKDNEKVKLVCHDNHIGYRKPRMKTRYYSASIDSDYFIKLI